MPNSDTVLDHPLVSNRYFYPRAASIPNPHWVDAGDGSKLACYYQQVSPEAPTVVYFHGNGEVVADYLPDFPAWITQAGYNVLLAEYRGYGMSTGRPALAGMLADVVPVLDSLNLPDRKIVLFGRSIGSLYAMHGVFERPQIAGLILESGVAEISERFFLRIHPAEIGASESDVVDELKHRFDYARKLGAFQGRTLVLHTRFDDLVDVHHAELLYAAAREPKQQHIFEQGGHNDIFFRNRDTYMQLVEGFLGAI